MLINRADIGDDRVEEYCRRENVPVLMHIPFDRKLAELYARGESIVLHSDRWRSMFEDLWEHISELVDSGKFKVEQKGEEAR